jgi:hypothetical protein
MDVPEPAPRPADDQAWLTVATLEDPLEAQLLEDVFSEAGIPVAMPGVQHRAMLGVLGGYVHIPVQVPEEHALEARQLIEAYRLNRAQAPTHENTAAAPDEAPTSQRVERSAMSAIGVSLLGAGVLVSVGAGHAYVRQYMAAVLLFVLAWSAAVALFMGVETWPALGLLILIDALGAARFARQSRREPGRAVSYHTAQVALLAVTALSLSPMLAQFLSMHFQAPPHTPELVPPLKQEWDGRER